MPTFPCALCDLAGERLFHVYVEYRGCRYYVASEQVYRDAVRRAHDYRASWPRAQTYIREQADSTQIDGMWDGAAKAMYVREEERRQGRNAN